VATIPVVGKAMTTAKAVAVVAKAVEVVARTRARVGAAAMRTAKTLAVALKKTVEEVQVAARALVVATATPTVKFNVAVEG
jgi:hypothetical protein